MSVPHVLIVDDDLAMLQALPQALRLRMKELTVDTCDSASTALEWIASIDYDAIVTDIKMPGMDGLALLTEIRALRPDTPALLITGHGEHDLAVRALAGRSIRFYPETDRTRLLRRRADARDPGPAATPAA